MRVWLLRALWLTLPVTAGTAAAEALDALGGPEAVGIVAAILCWAAWGLGTVALLAPRPQGLTAIRVLAPWLAALALVALATGTTDDLAGWGALAATGLALALSADPELAAAAANAVAYGDERRYPLRTPPALFCGPLPLVRALVGAGIAAPPLLLADGQLVAGFLALGVAAVAVPLAVRSLHGLSRRWVVLVPAGVVVADPLTLADPTLFVREHVRSLRAVRVDQPVTAGALDLRLGAAFGSVAITLDADTDLLRAGRGRRGGQTVHASELVVSVARRDELLADASARRVRVQAR